jgi:hypothetical protein
MALDSGIHAGMTVLFHSIWLMTAGIIYCELPKWCDSDDEMPVMACK